MAGAVDRVGTAVGTAASYPLVSLTRPNASPAEPAKQVRRPVSPSVSGPSERAVTEEQQGSASSQPAPAKGPTSFLDAIEKLGIKTKTVRLDFSTDEDTGEVIVKVIDRESGKVVREIPPEELRRVAKVLEELRQKTDGTKGQLVEVVT